MSIDVFDEDGEALRSAAELRWGFAVCARAFKHDPGIAEMHLCAARCFRVAVAVVLGESEYLCEPGDRFGDVLINDVRQHNICRHGAVLDHGISPDWRCNRRRGGGCRSR